MSNPCFQFFRREAIELCEIPLAESRNNLHKHVLRCHTHFPRWQVLGGNDCRDWEGEDLDVCDTRATGLGCDVQPCVSGGVSGQGRYERLSEWEWQNCQGRSCGYSNRENKSGSQTHRTHRSGSTSGTEASEQTDPLEYNDHRESGRRKWDRNNLGRMTSWTQTKGEFGCMGFLFKFTCEISPFACASDARCKHQSPIPWTSSSGTVHACRHRQCCRVCGVHRRSGDRIP